MRGLARAWAAVGAAALVGGCAGGPQRVLSPDSDAAEALAKLSWLLTAGVVVPAAFVMGLLIWLLFRRSPEQAAPPADSEGRMLVWASAGVALLLVMLLGGSLATTSRLAEIEGEPDLTVEVIAHQFWWEVRYPDLGIVIANELHLPAKKRTRVLLSSADVIHSFWVPELHGKRDTLPGRVQAITLEPKVAGLYRGQCAEFCGVQHALMALWVEAMEEEAFARWVAQRQTTRAQLPTPQAEKGRVVFAQAGCAHCHTVRGVFAPVAEGAVGPDLTHFAVRKTIGAATVPNTPENLRVWIRHPDEIKPGVKMPATPLPDDELDALVSYLGTLR